MILFKADPNTKFRIDWSHWEHAGMTPSEVMRPYLCEKCREELDNLPAAEELVDGVDMITGEVHRVSIIHEHLVACCSQQRDYLRPTIPLSNALLRALLATWDNQLTPVELQKRLGRSDPQAIFRLLTKGPVRDRIVPVLSTEEI